MIIYKELKRLRQIFIPIFTFAICIGSIGWWTYGFKAFTVFSYTLKEASPLNQIFPDIQLINHNGEEFHIKDKNKYKLVNFVYLNCPSVCHKVNNKLENIYHLMDSTIVPSQIEFITISFDLKNDDIEKIKLYRNHFGNDIEGWIFALPYQTNQKDFDTFLKNIGVWIYKNPRTGIINHSTSLYLLSPNNEVVKIFDPNRSDNQDITQEIQQCVKAKEIVSL